LYWSERESDASNEGIAKIAMIAKIAEIEKKTSPRRRGGAEKSKSQKPNRFAADYADERGSSKTYHRGTEKSGGKAKSQKLKAKGQQLAADRLVTITVYPDHSCC
jgi:hypothetical protein